MMTKASKLLKMVEDLIDPQQPYPVSKEMNKHSGLNNGEKEWTRDTQNKLVKEAMRHVDQSNDDTPAAQAIMSYTGSGYGPVNNHLRHGTPLTAPHHQSVVENLKHLTKNPTEHEFTVYRGAKEKLFDHQPGTTFKDKGFTSTSLRPSLAYRFASRDNKGMPVPEEQEKHMYRIHVTPGTRGHYVSGHSAVGSDAEREFILHPGTTFRVGQQHQHQSGHTYTDLHIHSQEE